MWKNRLCQFLNFRRILLILIVCSVSWFLWNTNKNFKNIENITTYLDLEQKHKVCNEFEPLDYKPSRKRNCPENGIVTAYQGGRLGNQIWEYMSIWLVAKKTGLEPFVPSCIKKTLSPFLDNLNLPVLEDIRNCPVKREVVLSRANSPWIYNHSLVLPMYAETPELLAEKINEINQVFSIKKSFLDQSQDILRQSKQFVNSSIDTFIGVHVRRTDYFHHLKVLYNLVPDNVTIFFMSAMNYFEKKYPNSIFILVSDDPDWCSKVFTSKKVYVAAKYNQTSPELDMALMASCNHSIIDYGTYGQWSAIFAGGETVYYEVNKGQSSELISKHLSSEVLSKLLKNWHTLNTSDIIDVSDEKVSLVPVT